MAELAPKGSESQLDTHRGQRKLDDVMAKLDLQNPQFDEVKRVFTEKGYTPFVGSTKSLSGHALGAAGVHEAIYSILMLRDGFLAKSANIENLVDEAEDMKILLERHDGQVTRVMSNSFGFGGTNACLVFDKYTE